MHCPSATFSTPWPGARCRFCQLLYLNCLLCSRQPACTHLETCECDEIRAMVNATVEEAISRLESKLSFQISNSNLTTAVQKLLKPIQRQLDYHLPLPPTPMTQEVFTAANPATSCNTMYDKYPEAEPNVKIFFQLCRTRSTWREGSYHEYVLVISKNKVTLADSNSC